MDEKKESSQLDPLAGLDGKDVAVLIPVYNDWLSVSSLLPMLDDEIRSIGAIGHVILVDDCSSYIDPNCLSLEHKFDAIDSIDIVYLFSNQGNQRAISVGLGYVNEHMDCDYLVIMDGDHEDKPQDVTRLIKKCGQDNDRNIVFAERTLRSEGFYFAVCYWIYRRLFLLVVGEYIRFGNFCVVPRKLVGRIARLDYIWNHFAAGIIRSKIPYALLPSARGHRLAGQSTMNLVRLINHAINGFAVFAEYIAIRTMLGAALVLALCIFSIIFAVMMRVFLEVTVSGWTSIIIGILIIISIQSIATALLLTFSVSLHRMQISRVPADIYDKFVRKSVSLDGKKGRLVC